MSGKASISTTFQKRSADIQASWMQQLSNVSVSSSGRIANEDLKRQAGEFLKVFAAAIKSGRTDSIDGSEWAEVRSFLEDLSRQRALVGFGSDDTATFVFSLKRPLFEALRVESLTDPQQLADDIWTVTLLLDALGLHTVKAYQRAREDVIHRQQQELLELSTPSSCGTASWRCR
jgi:rsbT co-antagonist protein RsbR